MLEPSECAERVGAILDSLGIEWALVGALAAFAYRATPRLTTDADLLIDRADGVAEALVEAGHRVDVMGDPGEPPHLLRVRGSGMAADLLVALVPYQRLALARATDHVITAEDVVVHKLIAWRPRDRDDIQSILETGRALDEEYIEARAREWEVEQRWEQARRSR